MRQRALYADLLPAFARGTPASANSGLVYDRYADVWSGPPDWKPETPQQGPSAEQQFMMDIAAHAKNTGRNVAPLLSALHRRRAALWHGMGARPIDVALVAPMVSGLGMAHALEVGFVWDRNLGVPYIPATGLKGAARAWALQWDALPREAALRIFGDLPDPGAGSIIFHALYPVAPAPLRVDVLNPHAGSYNGKGETPGDWLEPKPVFFLTVPPEVAFRTAVQPRRGTPTTDLDLAERTLRSALALLGVGGKTAVGYGVFTPADAQRPAAKDMPAANRPIARPGTGGRTGPHRPSPTAQRGLK